MQLYTLRFSETPVNKWMWLQLINMLLVRVLQIVYGKEHVKIVVHVIKMNFILNLESPNFCFFLVFPVLNQSLLLLWLRLLGRPGFDFWPTLPARHCAIHL